MAGALTTWRASVRARLEDVPGLRVADDPRALNPPCALVGFPATVTIAGSCLYAVVMPVFLVAPPPGSGSSSSWLVDQLTTVLRALHVFGAVEARATELGVGEGAAPQPAYQIDITTTITEGT